MGVTQIMYRICDLWLFPVSPHTNNMCSAQPLWFAQGGDGFLLSIIDMGCTFFFRFVVLGILQVSAPIPNTHSCFGAFAFGGLFEKKMATTSTTIHIYKYSYSLFLLVPTQNISHENPNRISYPIYISVILNNRVLIGIGNTEYSYGYGYVTLLRTRSS